MQTYERAGNIKVRNKIDTGQEQSSRTRSDRNRKAVSVRRFRHRQYHIKNKGIYDSGETMEDLYISIFVMLPKKSGQTE